MGVLTLRGKRRLPGAPGLLGIRQLYKVASGRGYLILFLSRYLERLVKSPVYLPALDNPRLR